MNRSSRLVVAAGAWCFFVLTLCGCATRLQAQACVGGQCQIRPVQPVERTRDPHLVAIIPRSGSADYDRLVYRIQTDEAFRRRVCPLTTRYYDELPAKSQQHVRSQGMPYFYWSDAIAVWTIGFDDGADFLGRIEAMRPEARAAAAERQRIDRERRATEAAEQAQRERQAAEAQNKAKTERQHQAEEAERLRQAEESRIEEDRRRREREAEEIEQEIETPHPPPKKRPSVRPVIREGVQVAGKAAAHWAFPKIIAALGISPEVAGAMAIIVGSGGTAVGIYAAFLGGAALLRRLRGKKKASQ